MAVVGCSEVYWKGGCWGKEERYDEECEDGDGGDIHFGAPMV
jgi:hypothetical protein